MDLSRLALTIFREDNFDSSDDEGVDDTVPEAPRVKTEEEVQAEEKIATQKRASKGPYPSICVCDASVSFACYPSLFRLTDFKSNLLAVRFSLSRY